MWGNSKMPLSEYFILAFSDSGTICASCEFCGRVHFGGDGDFDEGELESLKTNAEKEPDKYVDHGDEWVGLLHLAGRTGVVDCPCNKMDPYEQFIWGHGWKIAEYLRRRSASELKTAEATAHALEIPEPLGKGSPVAVPILRRKLESDDIVITVPKTGRKLTQGQA